MSKKIDNLDTGKYRIEQDSRQNWSVFDESGLKVANIYRDEVAHILRSVLSMDRMKTYRVRVRPIDDSGDLRSDKYYTTLSKESALSYWNRLIDSLSEEEDLIFRIDSPWKEDKPWGSMGIRAPESDVTLEVTVMPTKMHDSENYTLGTTRKCIEEHLDYSVEQ